MMQSFYTFILILAFSNDVVAENHRHGEIRIAEKVEAWDEVFKEWVTPEEFWRNYALSGDGASWGVGRDYPPYKKLQEHDTFLIKTDSGLCLMEFFHSRWRRANDVRRWDPAFNDYGGCPYVFD